MGYSLSRQLKACKQSWKDTVTSVLVLDGLEFIFFIVACVALVTHARFSRCRAAFAQHQGPFCSSPCPTSEQAGDVHGAGRGHSQDGWPRLTPEISHTILQHRNKNCEDGGERRDIRRYGNSHRDETRHCRKWLNICLPTGSIEWIPYFASACGFPLLTELSLSRHTRSRTSTFLISPPSHYGEQASSWKLFSSQLGLNHNNQWTELQLMSACFLYHHKSYYSPVMKNIIFKQEIFAKLMLNYEKILCLLSGWQSYSKA